MEKALEDATAEQSARLFRKIEYLSVIGNIAPMVGLLGTVTGMIFAFQQVAEPVLLQIVFFWICFFSEVDLADFCIAVVGPWTYDHILWRCGFFS